MSEPQLVATDALDGHDVGISVSDSADLGRLGLTSAHCELAVAEITRAVLLAGGSVTYGGRLRPAGFTQVIMDEVLRYASGRQALTICVAEPEHRDFLPEELRSIDNRLGTSARMVLLSERGEPLSTFDDHPLSAGASTEDSAALSALRRHLAQRCTARVVVGGKLTGYQGAMPGVVEEALLSLQAQQPLYAAGGFGGAAAAVARSLGYDDLAWAPTDLPAGARAPGAREALDQLITTARDRPPTRDGLDEAERRALAASPRAGDIASLTVLGLARTRHGA